MTGITWLVAAVRFGCEIAAAVALCVWGVDVTDGAGSIVLAVLAPLGAVVIWGAFVAPKARSRLADPARAVVELVVFAAAVIALLSVDHAVYALVLAIAAVLSAVLTRVLDAEERVAESVGG